MTSPLDQAWELSASVALRPETFGAMAYHFGNRRLTFLKRTELVSVVGALADQPDARAALTYAGVPAARWPAYAEALRSLAATDMIRLRTEAGTPPQALPRRPRHAGGRGECGGEWVERGGEDGGVRWSSSSSTGSTRPSA